MAKITKLIATTVLCNFTFLFSGFYGCPNIDMQENEFEKWMDICGEEYLEFGEIQSRQTIHYKEMLMFKAIAQLKKSILEARCENDIKKLAPLLKLFDYAAKEQKNED